MSHLQPSTPPRRVPLLEPFTPETPTHESPSKVQALTPIRPKRVLQLETTSSMITPDYTPKIKKRQQLYEELMQSLEEEKEEDLPKTPKEQITKSMDLIEDKFEPHFTISSPSIRKNKTSSHIFQHLDSPIKKKQVEDSEFDPHTEILLIGKSGDRVIKKFSEKGFDRTFKPRLLLQELKAPESTKLTLDDELAEKLMLEAAEDDLDYSDYDEIDPIPTAEAVAWWLRVCA